MLYLNQKIGLEFRKGKLQAIGGRKAVRPRKWDGQAAEEQKF